MVRFKNRYITFGIDNGKDITHPLELTSGDLFRAVIGTVNYVHGDVGCSAIKPGLNVKYCNELTKVGIIKVRHGPHKIVLSVLPFIRDIKNISVSVNLLYVGATLQHCYKVLLKYQQTELNKVLCKLQSTDDQKLLKSKLLTLESFKSIMESNKSKSEKEDTTF